MNTPCRLWASFATLLVACFAHAADPKPAGRVISVLEVETDDPSGYVNWIDQYNRTAKAKLGIDSYLRVYETQNDGRKSGRLAAVVAAASVMELTKHSQALEAELATLQGHLRFIRSTGGRTLYHAVRFEGADKNGSLYGTLAVVNDEAGYLKALDQLRAILDSGGLKDAKINVYRVLAGRTDHTHRINIVVPSPERLAAVLDFVATNPQASEWIANSAKFRTVVANLTARDITK